MKPSSSPSFLTLRQIVRTNFENKIFNDENRQVRVLHEEGVRSKLQKVDFSQKILQQSNMESKSNPRVKMQISCRKTMFYRYVLKIKLIEIDLDLRI